MSTGLVRLTLLQRHPDSAGAAVTQIAVEVTRGAHDELALRYIVTGNINSVHLPAVTAPVRADDLWRSTCFEAFLQPQTGAGYYEFNFAPSTAWAAYRFSGYRDGMAPFDSAAPLINVQSNTDSYELLATLALSGALSGARLGLSAVIEETNGDKSYWALAHPAGKPDFHRVDSFAYELPAAERP